MTGKWRGLLLLAVLLPAMLSATVIRVPDVRPTIQLGVDAASDGDTVSVWGDTLVPPPYVYYENVNFGAKSVFLVNRSFLPYQTPGYDSSWDHVVIDGSSSGPVVVMGLGSSPVLKGLTIQHGLNPAQPGGGGVICQGGRVEKNRIRVNSAYAAGGGVRCVVHSGGAPAVIADNLIEDNSTYTEGGGISVHNGGPDVDIRRNVIRYNKALQGGGVCLKFIPDDSSYSLLYTERFSDNVVDGNELLGSDRGGGVYETGYPFAARRNTITNNTPNGVYLTDYNPQLAHLDFGTASDPGFNIIADNGDHDLVAAVSPDPNGRTIQYVGTYWGAVGTSTIMDRVVPPPPLRPFLYDPIAASGKWFSIDGEQLCETDVLVTGDLVVEPEASLSIAPGKTVTFYAAPDHVETGHDPALCDLIVQGADGALDASGTESDSIRFIGEGPCGVMWGGIHFDAGSIGALSHCVVTDAYSGIRSSSATELAIADSRIESCEYCGVDISGGDATVSSSRLAGNGVYGVAMDQVGAGAHVSVTGCDITGNGVAGVRVKGTFGQDAQCSVSGNIIEAGSTPVQPAYGILVDNVRYGLSCEDNHCTGFHDAGIGVKASTFAANGNVLVANTYAGYSLMDRSTPSVRTTVVSQSKAGIQNDETSLGDFGSVGSPGLNSVVDNFYYVLNLNSRSALPAVYNWWGTPVPNPGRFIGPVSYYPWLTEPPQGGDGGQSAGAAGVTQPRFGVWPLPLRDRGTIAWTVDAPGPASVRVYDATGREVCELANRRMMPGRYTAEWDGRRADGSLLPNGVYVCKVRTSTEAFSRKVTVVK